MNIIDPQTLAEQLAAFIRDEIPLARTMGLALQHYDGKELRFITPLAPNVNDKGCAFGGSLVSLMTLAGWALVELALRQRGEDCDLYVADSHVRYLQPVWSDFVSEARLAHNGDWAVFFQTLAARGKARIDVSCRIPATADASAATLAARFVAKRRS